MDYSDFEDYAFEPKDKLVRFSPEVVTLVRKEVNFNKKQNRDQAIDIIEEWIKKQDHFLKKNFCRGYIERCLVTCKGSLERAKQQIDTICTMKTVMAKYFEVTHMKHPKLTGFLEKCYCAITPKLTKECYRAVILKFKPDCEYTSEDFMGFIYFLLYTAEYLKSTDCSRGYYFVADIHDGSAVDILTKVDFVAIKDYLPILTRGYGCKIKGIFLVTASKAIETFIKMLKPMLTEKIGSRMHAVSSRKMLQDIINDEVLPKEYGGPEASVEELHEKLMKSFSSETVQSLVEEMYKAKTDESKRQIDDFNNQYMGMPGTFRTLSLD